MLSHKKYMEIQNLNPEIGDMFEPGDQIIIQEKIDGSNASFQYDRETDSVICFSRKSDLVAGIASSRFLRMGTKTGQRASTCGSGRQSANVRRVAGTAYCTLSERLL